MKKTAWGLVACAVAACSSEGAPAGDWGWPSTPARESSDESPAAASGGGAPEAGTLTAGAWDDNLNFDFYKTYLDGTGGAARDVPVVAREDRLVINVVDAHGAPLSSAKIRVEREGATVFEAPAGSATHLFFPSWYGVAAGTPLDIIATSPGAWTKTTVNAGEPDVTITVDSPQASKPLDVAFVIDTTGSMGDEIDYLKAEVGAIAEGITAAHPGVQTRWALVLYRDEGDAYESRVFDFTGDLGTFRQKLQLQQPGGGGDYEEAVHTGLERTEALSWKAEAASRVAFFVADAPHHASKTPAIVNAIRGLRAKGVHVYPVASSGVDERFEATMRSVAQLTGGRYLFITNDSGVGGDHKDPTLPCYFVTKLDDAILRMIDVELSDRFVEPLVSKVIRTGGNPADRRCTLASGMVVIAL